MIVHMPADVSSMEAANCHDGLYFVLMGQVSPAQGMDISAVALDKLVARLQASDIEENYHCNQLHGRRRRDSVCIGRNCFKKSSL